MPNWRKAASGVLLLLLAQSAITHAQSRLDPVVDSLPMGNKPGNPTYEVPPGQRLISPFGERPAFSPDGRKIAFIGKSYGDAFEYDIATRRIRNLTAHTPHDGFLRVHYLADGSIVLLGPHIPAATREATRNNTIEAFWLDPQAAGALVPLKITVWEGLATSRESNRIAWAELDGKGKDGPTTTIRSGTVQVRNGAASLVDVKEVITSPGCMVEAQDFLPGEKGLTMPCYHMSAADREHPVTEVISVDFATKTITRYPTPRSLFGELEGLFPDGKHALVECAADRALGMDLCILEMKTVSPKYLRLTHIQDYGQWKYGNPVVSPDGRTIAAQVGPAKVIDAGVGLGIVLIDTPKSF